MPTRHPRDRRLLAALCILALLLAAAAVASPSPVAVLPLVVLFLAAPIALQRVRVRSDAAPVFRPASAVPARAPPLA